jgi:hypothetical protein
MSNQVSSIAFLEAIERERRAWDALQHPSQQKIQDGQTLYAAWALAVAGANLEAERFLKASRCRRRALNPDRATPWSGD